VVYGREPPPLVWFEKGTTPVSMVEQQLLESDVILDELKAQLLRAQAVMKKRADRERREVKFQVGDLVHLKLRSYCQRSLAARANEKLAARYYGPFEIAREVGPVAYTLKLPPHCLIHPTFHVSQLREAKGAVKATIELPQQLNEDLEMVVEPSAVLGVRLGAGKNMQEAEVLIQWKELPPLEANWEPYSVIQQQFPFFYLEDKVKVGGESNVRPPVHLTYQRRSKGQQLGVEM